MRVSAFALVQTASNLRAMSPSIPEIRRKEHADTPGQVEGASTFRRPPERFAEVPKRHSVNQERRSGLYQGSRAMDEGESITTEGLDETDRRELLWWIQDANEAAIRFADAKAGAILGFALATTGWTFNH